MKSKSSYLVKNLLLFFIAVFVPKAMTFFMMPLYTNTLTTAEYGIADLMNSTISLLLPLCTLQVQDALLRFSMEDGVDPKEVFSIGTRIDLTGASIVSGVAILLKFTGIVKLDMYLVVFLVISLFTHGLCNSFSYFCRGINKVQVITIGTISNTIVTIGANLVLLLYFHLGVRGYLVANIIGFIVNLAVLYFVPKLYQYFSFEINKELRKEMVLFSVPMIVSALSWWINNASDKYILTFFKGVSEVGVYSASSKIPSILSAFSSVIASAFSISAIKEFDSNDNDGFIGNSYHYISVCFSLLCSFLMVINIPLSKVLFAKDFFRAYMFVPPLLLSILFNLMGDTCTSLFVAKKNTKFVSLSAIIGAIVNTTLNFILIPTFGAYGAAVATVIGFFITWLSRYIKAKKIIRFKNNITKERITYLVLLAQMIFSYIDSFNMWVLAIGFLAILLLSAKELKSIIGSFWNTFRNKVHTKN